MPRKTAGSGNGDRQWRGAPETNAAVLRALDNLDAAVSKLSDVVGKIISQPCDIQHVESAEHPATLVPSEILPPMTVVGGPPRIPIVELTESPNAEMPSAMTDSPTEADPQHGFAERLLNARHRTHQ